MSWVIVALPEDRDPVWEYSSEKKPHMTLLFLGDKTNNADLPNIVQYIQHVAKTALHPFGMMTDRRGTLGDDQADVLFFEKDKHGLSSIDRVRTYLLKDPGIKTLYDSAQQYPEWTPHLTMGYPQAPAKEDKENRHGFGYVQFDRLALWTQDYEGPEFRLEWRSEMSSTREFEMSDELGEFLSHFGAGVSPTEKFLAHFGVKGMRWGRRKNDDGSHVSVTVKETPGKPLLAKGGQNAPASQDAIQTKAVRQLAKASTLDSVSTKDLQEAVTRMNLEAQYTKLTAAQLSPGRKFVNDLLLNTAKQQATKIVGDQANTILNEQMKKRGVA